MCLEDTACRNARATAPFAVHDTEQNHCRKTPVVEDQGCMPCTHSVLLGSHGSQHLLRSRGHRDEGAADEGVDAKVGEDQCASYPGHVRMGTYLDCGRSNLEDHVNQAGESTLAADVARDDDLAGDEPEQTDCHPVVQMYVPKALG